MSAHKAIRGKKLYQILFFGVIFTVLAVGALAFWGVREIRRDAAVVAVESSARGVSGAVTVLINAVTASNDEIGTNVLKSLKSASLRSFFAGMMKKHPALASVMVSDGEGVQYVLTRRADGMLEGVPDTQGTTAMLWTHVQSGVSRKVEANESFNRPSADAVLSAEFRQLRPGQVNWRSAAAFQHAGESWLTASTLVESGGEYVMVSYVFPIDAVIKRLGGAEKGSAEKIFLYWDSGLVLPVSDSDDGAVKGEVASQAFSSDQVVDPVVRQAAILLGENGRNRKAPFSYTVDKAVWWAYIMPLSVFGDTMSIGVAVPRENIVSALTSDSFLQVFGTILVLCAGVVLFVLHRNRARIESMGLRQRAARTAEDVLHLIAEGESSTVEFKQTLRFNLKSGKNGKEIEHANLKTVAGFMNSEGGTLLVGVADNGSVAGFEEDGFDSDDKALLHFNNLVNQHIGTEFARYLDTTVIEVQGKSVIRVYCMPAAAPAILTNGKTEEFYVRSGPASRQLTLSQFYEWLQNH